MLVLEDEAEYDVMLSKVRRITPPLPTHAPIPNSAPFIDPAKEKNGDKKRIRRKKLPRSNIPRILDLPTVDYQGVRTEEGPLKKRYKLSVG